jgi:hypothetical protein
MVAIKESSTGQGSAHCPNPASRRPDHTPYRP